MNAFLSPAVLAAQLDAVWAPVLDRIGSGTPVQEKAAQRQYQSAKALERLIMAGEVRTPEDAMAQALVAIGELRYAHSVEGAEAEAEAATDVIAGALVALARLLKVDLAAMGAGLYLAHDGIESPLMAVAA